MVDWGLIREFGIRKQPFRPYLMLAACIEPISKQEKNDKNTVFCFDY